MITEWAILVLFSMAVVVAVVFDMMGYLDYYAYAPIAVIVIVSAPVTIGAWLNERKRKRTRDMYRDIDMKEWV